MPMVYSNDGHSFGNQLASYVLKIGEKSLPEGATPAQILAAFPKYNDPVSATVVLSHDLMLLFTVADYTKIKDAQVLDNQFGLYWTQLQTNKDQMSISDTYFKTRWAALVQVLGQPRMTAIATALNVVIV